jgi:hypothetical protein
VGADHATRTHLNTERRTNYFATERELTHLQRNYTEAIRADRAASTRDDETLPIGRTATGNGRAAWERGSRPRQHYRVPPASERIGASCGQSHATD